MVRRHRGRDEIGLTGEVGRPVGVAVAGKHDRVVDIVSFDMVEYAHYGGKVAVPGVL